LWGWRSCSEQARRPRRRRRFQYAVARTRSPSGPVSRAHGDGIGAAGGGRVRGCMGGVRAWSFDGTIPVSPDEVARRRCGGGRAASFWAANQCGGVGGGALAAGRAIRRTGCAVGGWASRYGSCRIARVRPADAGRRRRRGRYEDISGGSATRGGSMAVVAALRYATRGAGGTANAACGIAASPVRQTFGVAGRR